MEGVIPELEKLSELIHSFYNKYKEQDILQDILIVSAQIGMQIDEIREKEGGNVL